MPRSTDILPVLYYYDHFNEMVDFVCRVYGDILANEEIDFIEDFRSLDRSSQCLFIRMCNRLKPIFHFNDLQYDEIETRDALVELLERGYIRAVANQDYQDLLSVMSKATLLDFAKTHDLDVRTSWSKPKLAQFLKDTLAFEMFERGLKDFSYYVPVRKPEVQYFLYLYFGKASDSLTSFALRDLGLITVNRREEYTSRFQNRQESKAGFFYTQAIKALKSKQQSEFQRLSQEIGAFPVAETEYVSVLQNSVLHSLGLHYEKLKDLSRAIDIYKTSNSFECRERLVRILYTQKDTQQAQTLLDEMMNNPSSDEEHLFASDFYARKFGKQKLGIYTELLRSGKTISVDEFYRGTPEFAATRHFKKEQWTGYHVENMLWNSLFGLIFWEELFEDKASINSDFDWSPQLLRSKRFNVHFQNQIQDKLAVIRNGSGSDMVLKTWKEKRGKANGVFGWYDDLRQLLVNFLNLAPPSGVAQMLDLMASDYYAMRDGFPDLMLIKGKSLKFVEVKTEGDQIRRNQLARMTQLRKAGFEVEICRVDYHVDPDQTYVVIDVETTGGRPPNDRITEIGAVKVQNGKVIDEWQSLINPERHIPGYITDLTGISNAMVRDAPVFAEIADELEAFMDGSVFVAHNVNFDYGFVSSEFKMLEREFKYPKLCTVASMRRHYPGHSSYSLHNICREYGVSLKTHHRALCDAKAAAELLILVNAKRLAQAALSQAA